MSRYATIKAAIEASREREALALNPFRYPWDADDIAEVAEEGARFREALAVGVRDIEELRACTLHDRTAQWCDASLSRIAAILKGKP